MNLYENIKDNLKEDEENYGPIYVWRTYLNGNPSDDYTSYEAALKDAKENGCEEIEKYTWYNSNDYDNYKDADRIETVWTNTMNEAEEPEKNYEQMSLDFSEPIGFRYIYNFMLQCPVNDFDAASSYLTADDMREYIDEDLKDVVTRVEWILDDTSEGHVEVDTNRELTDEEKTKMIDWIEGQNSDGLGEGFEQQDFAESYYNPVNGDGPFTRSEAEEEVQRLYDELEPSEYADYIDDRAMENAIDRYIEENYDEESAEEVDRYEIQDTILEDPESYFDYDDIDNAKNKAIQGDSLYNENDWYTMASINWQNHKDDFDSVEELRTKGV